MRAFLDSDAFAEGFKEYIAALLEKVAREKPKEFAIVARVFMADAEAAVFAERYQEKRIRITYDEAVQLTFGLAWNRVPYSHAKKNGKRPKDALPYIYDYEIQAAKARKSSSALLALVERSNTEKLAWDTLQECIKKSAKRAGAYRRHCFLSGRWM